jgi:hypothetical protein
VDPHGGALLDNSHISSRDMRAAAGGLQHTLRMWDLSTTNQIPLVRRSLLYDALASHAPCGLKYCKPATPGQESSLLFEPLSA